MADTDFWVAIAIAINLFINIGASSLFQYRRLEQLESYFAGNEYFERNRSLRSEGYLGRQMRLNIIFVTMLMARRLHKNGFLGKDEEKKIPKKIRYQVNAIYIHLTMTMVCALLFHFITTSNSS